MALADVVPEGDRLKSLRSLRDRLAVQIDGTDSGRDVAALSLRLMDVLAQIAEVEAKQAPSGVKTPLEILRERRAAQAASPRARRASGSA